MLLMKPNEILDEFKNIYLEAEKIYNIEVRAECFLSLVQYIPYIKNADIDISFWRNRGEILLAYMMKLIENHDGHKALYIYNLLPNNIRKQSDMLYYLGLIYYENKEYNKMIDVYKQIKNVYDDRENFHFFLGNAYYQIGLYEKAKLSYKVALRIRKNFKEARKNFNLLDKGMYCQDIEYYPWKSSIEANGINFKKWPIFINSRDRVGCLKKLINWLLDRNYENIIILDNDSTYDELLLYYKEIEKKKDVKIIYLKKNFGHKAIWQSGILEELNINTPYVYTDSDIIPDKKCPDNIVEQLYDILVKYNYLYKVGLSLKISDITIYIANDIKKHESGFYSVPIEPNVYMAPVDTTFALYRNYRSYSLFNTEAMRLRFEGGELIHIPWYYDKDNLPEDEKYYIKHANSSSTLSVCIKEKNIYKE